MTATITTPQITKLLEKLYADAAANDPLAHRAAKESGAAHRTSREFFQSMRKAYLAIGPEFGRLLCTLVRATRAQRVVEFGTSFGVSTIYLASALRDNGGGKLITTEFDPEKTEQAKRNLTEAGLVDLVEFRVGDALETLAELSGETDMVFLDGAKELYLNVLRLLEPTLRSGAIVASDNTDHEGIKPFLEYVRDPVNGYVSAAVFTEGHLGKAHEVTVRS